MTDLTERRELAAAPEQVWLALTTADAVRGWFWPPRFHAVVEADAREGGQYRIASEVAGIAVGGKYTVLQSPALAHSGLDDDQLGQHARGWSDCLDRLPDWLAAH